MANVNKKKVALGVGLGLAAAAAAGAGYYFYGAKGAAANRRKVEKWANDLKRDVTTKAKKLKKLDEKAFKVIVDESIKAYEKVKSVDPRDLQVAALELKSNWQSVQKELSRVAKKDVKIVKKAAKKVVGVAKSAAVSNAKIAKKPVAKKKKS